MTLLITPSTNRPTIRKHLKGIWGGGFIPKRFDVCVIASSLDEAYSVYGDETGDTCVDPDAGTVVRFIRLRVVVELAA